MGRHEEILTTVLGVKFRGKLDMSRGKLWNCERQEVPLR